MTADIAVRSLQPKNPWGGDAAYVSIKYIIKPVLILYIAVATAAAWFTDTYGVFVDTDMVRNAFETTKAETQDLLTPGLIKHFALYFFLPTAFLTWIRIVHQPFGR